MGRAGPGPEKISARIIARARPGPKYGLEILFRPCPGKNPKLELGPARPIF